MNGMSRLFQHIVLLGHIHMLLLICRPRLFRCEYEPHLFQIALSKDGSLMTWNVLLKTLLYQNIFYFAKSTIKLHHNGDPYT